MYGFIYNTLRNLVVENFGLETWESICVESGSHSIKEGILDRQYYEEAYLPNIARVATEKLGISEEKIFEMFGAFFFKTCKKSGHSSILRTLGHNLYGFLLNLDTLHDHLSFTYTKMRAPSFRCEKTSTGLTLFYYSQRQGLSHIVTGIVKAVAKDFYQLDIIVDQVSYEVTDGKLPHYYVLSIEVEESAKNGNYVERLTGDINAPLTLNALPPVDAEQEMWFDSSYLHHRYALKGRGSGSMQDLAAGEGRASACPMASAEDISKFELPSETKDLIQQQIRGSHMPHWPALSMSRYQSRRGSCAPGEGATTDWPITPHLFQLCFPFHVVFDKDLVICYMGVSLTRIIPKAIISVAKLNDYFCLDRPKLAFTYDNIRTSLHNSFVLYTKSSVMLSNSDLPKEPLYFRGQMVLTSRCEGAEILFLCSPRVSSVEELENQGLYLSDIPVHDVTRDLLLLNRHFRVEIAIAAELEETKKDLEIQKACVEHEKQRADQLLHAMLPSSVASQLKSIGEARAMDYSSVTILFSDIKGFTTICNSVKPMLVVGMLNSLYTLFDSQSEKYKVYKVETIGDAYMVAAGLLDTSTEHAEAITNMAFGMMQEAGKVMEPTNQTPLQVRIGIHTGPVVAGVVGRKMPRFCLFGDTVNTASRMESHGEAGKVHMSEATYSYLEGNPLFKFESRGKIMIKGLGERQTFFVELADDATRTQNSSIKKGSGLHSPVVVDMVKPPAPLEEAWRPSQTSHTSTESALSRGTRVTPAAESVDHSKRSPSPHKTNPSLFIASSSNTVPEREQRTSRAKCVLC